MKIVEDYGIVDKASMEEEMGRERERMRLREVAEKREWLEGYFQMYRRKMSDT